MVLQNNESFTSQRLSMQLLQLLFPKTDDAGQELPFDDHIEVSNMIIGVNSVNRAMAYGTMLTRYTKPKKIGPVYSKRTFVSHPTKNHSFQLSDLKKFKRVYTIPHGYYQDKESVAYLLYQFEIRVAEHVQNGAREEADVQTMQIEEEN